ncbi:unnamed protein product, partial [Vitis vinifera]
MYVGFSAATEMHPNSHYILGWSLKMGSTEADPLDLSKIPSPPRNGTPSPGLGRRGIKIGASSAMVTLAHRHLVHLQGWCKRKGDLLLVYDYMSNGSLDTFLFQEDKNLDWGQRFRILKEIAAGLLYLHEEWEQVVVHRDVKANNVLLDSNMNARLGDFGLAKLYEHGKNPRTTHVVGTVGRPLDPNASSGKQMILQDWVAQCHQRGHILEAANRKLGNSYVKEEIELVLKVGLLCSDPEPQARPNMQQVTRYLSGFDPLPEVDASSLGFFVGSLDSKADSHPSSYGVMSAGSLATGRFEFDVIIEQFKLLD